MKIIFNKDLFEINYDISGDLRYVMYYYKCNHSIYVHRSDGPSIIYKNGKIMYYINGSFRFEDGFYKEIAK